VSAAAVEPLEPEAGSTNEGETAGALAPAPPLGLDAFDFNATFDQLVRCPNGCAPVEQEVRDAPIPYRATFDADCCSACPLADRCPTRQLKGGQRVLRWKPAKAATATRQHEQRQATFKEGYKIRSGVESTNAEYKGRHGAKKLRVRGEQRVAMMVRLKAAALNVKRAVLHHTELLAGLVEAAPREVALAM
jgi:hypothetical protein